MASRSKDRARQGRVRSMFIARTLGFHPKRSTPSVGVNQAHREEINGWLGLRLTRPVHFVQEYMSLRHLQ